jgi:hypothetical protein
MDLKIGFCMFVELLVEVVEAVGRIGVLLQVVLL